MSHGSLDPKIRFLGQKVCSVARLHTQTDTQTNTHESKNRGHLFRVSGVFPSTYHQGSAQYCIDLRPMTNYFGRWISVVSHPVLIQLWNQRDLALWYPTGFVCLRVVWHTETSAGTNMPTVDWKHLVFNQLYNKNAYFVWQFCVLGRSLMIGWRKKIMKPWNGAYSSHSVCLSVCVRATGHTFWHLMFRLNDP